MSGAGNEAASSRSGDGKESKSEMRDTAPSRASFLKIDSPSAATAVPGLYLFPGSLMSGVSLYLFPDGSAFIHEYSDLGPGDLLASGKWVFEKAGVGLSWSQWNTDAGILFSEARFPKKNLGRLSFYKRKYLETVGFALAIEGRDPAVDENCFVKVFDYLDWVEIKKSLTRPSAGKKSP
jgi:hypothetical protein